METESGGPRGLLSWALDHESWNGILVFQGEEGGHLSKRTINLALGLILLWELEATVI